MSKDKLQPVELGIRIKTGIVSRNGVDEAMSEIEYTSYFINAINWFISMTASLKELVGNDIDRWEIDFPENSRLMLQIATALTDELTTYTRAFDCFKNPSNLVQMAERIKASETVSIPDLTDEVHGDGEKYTGNNEVDQMALALAGLLHNEKLPKGLRGHINDALGEIAQTEEVLTSPEYIAKVLLAEVK